MRWQVDLRTPRVLGVVVASRAVAVVSPSVSRRGTARAPLSAMRQARSSVVLVTCLALGAGAAAMACSDTDPKFGPPEAIRGRKIDYGVESPGSAPTDAGGTTGGTKTPEQLFNDLYATITGTGDGAKCTPCHGPGGAGVTLFVGTSAADGYAIFKAKGYQDITKANSFYTKGGHSGPALTAAQKTLTKTWADAELGGGGATAPTDAGTD